MRKVSSTLVAVVLGVALASSASAGIYVDDLSRCLVRSMKSDDRTALMRWMFALLSASPQLGSMSNSTPAQREVENKASAEVFQRLIFVDCHTEALDALKYEGAGAMGASFNTLGQVAVRGLMSDPAVGAELQRFGSYFDPAKVKALEAEAGLPSAPTQAK